MELVYIFYKCYKSFLWHNLHMSIYLFLLWPEGRNILSMQCLIKTFYIHHVIGMLHSFAVFVIFQLIRHIDRISRRKRRKKYVFDAHLIFSAMNTLAHELTTLHSNLLCDASINFMLFFRCRKVRFYSKISNKRSLLFMHESQKSL